MLAPRPPESILNEHHHQAGYLYVSAATCQG